MSMQFAAIVSLATNGSDSAGMAAARAMAAANLVDEMASSCAEAGVATIGPRFAVLGGHHASDIGSRLSSHGWKIIANPAPDSGHVAGLRLAMRALPLVDAFWLVLADGMGGVSSVDSQAALQTQTVPQTSNPTLPPRDCYPRMARAYQMGRLKLMRIVVPVTRGAEAWPWLVDIGFRQPFVELPDGGDLWTVVEANRGQVIGVEA